MNLTETIKNICPAHPADIERAWKRWDSIAKPLRSLGYLEEAVVKLAGMRGINHTEFKKPCVVVMCADNGVVKEGVTQAPQEVTAVVTRNFASGATSVCSMARIADAQVFPVDIGVASDIDVPGLLIHKVAYGTKNMTREAAMTHEEAVLAIETGIHIVYKLAEQGYDLFATGEMGIGNTTTSSAITAVLLEKSPRDVTGRGAGLSRDGLARKIFAIERAIALNRPNPSDVLDVLAKVGGLDIAGLIGVYLAGAALRLPVVLDGFISATAALCAVRLCPAVADYILPSHLSEEPAGAMLLETLGLKPFLTCGMHLGEGTGAVAAIPLLRMGCAVYHDMSTFEEIQIDDYTPFDHEECEESGCGGQ